MSAQQEGPAPVCSPQELVDKGYQPVFCTLNQSGVHTPLVGTTGAKSPWPVLVPEPAEPYRLALRPPPDVLIVDVDDHDGLGTGPRTLAAMEAELGPLPPTWRLSARGAHNPAGRLLFRIPPDLVVTDALFKQFGGDIEAVRTGWRFSWAPGDINPKTGTPVEVFGPDNLPTELPAVAQLPPWPQAWVQPFRTAPQPVAQREPGAAATPLQQFMAQQPPARLSAAQEAIRRKLDEVASHTGSGFRNLLSGAALMMAGYVAGAPHLFDAQQLQEALYDAVGRRWGQADAEDQRWIEEGWHDGLYKHPPLRVYDETQPYAGQFPDNVVQLPGTEQPAWMPVDRLAQLEALLVDADGLRNIKPPEFLVDGWLFRDSLAWLSGAPGDGKTFAAVDLACSVATGTPWQGYPVKQGPVLYLIAEGVSGLSQRVDAWSLHHGKPVDGVIFLPVPVQLFKGGETEVFAALVAKYRPALVILDTQARVTVGAVENAAEDMGLFIHNLGAVRAAAGSCVLTIHHSPRNGDNLRGSTALEGGSDTILHATKDGATVTITQKRQKDIEKRPPLALTLKPSGSSVVLTSSAQQQTTGAVVPLYTESQRRVLNHLKQGNTWSATELMKHLDMAESTIYRVLPELRARGDIYLTDTTQPKRYAATVLGKLVSAYDAAQPVDNPPLPVDNLPVSSESAFGSLQDSPTASHEFSHDKTAGQSRIPTNSQNTPTGDSQHSHSPIPVGMGRGEREGERTGGSESQGSGLKADLLARLHAQAPAEAPPAPSEPEAVQAPLPPPAQPEPKKRAEPKPGTKAYERAQAKAAEKAARYATAAGRSVQYPAVVLRDGQVLETALSGAQALLEGLPVVTVDVETSGVPVGHEDYELRLIQLGCAEFAVDLDPKDPEQAALASRVLQAAPQLRAHSSTADVVPTALAGLAGFDSMMERMDDTAIRAKLHDPQSTGSDASLKKISDHMLGADSASTPADEARKDLFTAGGWLTEPKPTTPLERNGWYNVPADCETFARYGGSDVLDCALVGDLLPPLPTGIAWREQTVAHMVGRVALEGIPINAALLADLMAEHTVRRDELARQITSWTPIEHVGSDRQVAQALIAMGVRLPHTKPSKTYPEGQPSVAAGVLETIQGQLEETQPDHPAGVLIQQVLDWRHHDTVITLFLTPYDVLVRNGDGRARPTVYTLGADTGRMSCVRPNFQQLPREGGIRPIIVADEGMCFISADFSSVEIRVAAALSGDRDLQRMLDEGLDPHTMAARLVYNIPEGQDVPKAKRYKVKSGVFGRIYGGGVATLAEQMRVPQHIAQKLIDVIDQLWPTLSSWSKASARAVEQGLETTYTTYSGRIVHLPRNAAHASGNYKIQGTARELLMDALLRWRETKWGKCVLWPVHDEVDVMVPIEDAEAATAELVRCMETELFGVRIIAEPSEPSTYWRDSA